MHERSDLGLLNDTTLHSHGAEEFRKTNLTAPISHQHVAIAIEPYELSVGADSGPRRRV